MADLRSSTEGGEKPSTPQELRKARDPRLRNDVDGRSSRPENLGNSDPEKLSAEEDMEWHLLSSLRAIS